jgi:hypothetical protein
MNRFASSAAVLVVSAVTWFSQPAEACGCFAPPNATVPIVQAGERILFAVDNGVVTAHIQIQYAGDAKDFGWLLPLPSVPVVKVGTEELFTRLLATTQPRYLVRTVLTGNCTSQVGPVGVTASQGGDSFSPETANDPAPPAASPLVVQASIGPYDYAVLKADNKDAMLKWLADNRYFVPAGTEDAVGPYVQPGAFFLALKLKSGQSKGDIQPVVLEYPSQLPMIPLILTSVAAQPNMGVQVWVVGTGRAIPRNYNHVVLNDSQLDWLQGARNYNDVVIKAVAEAPEKHAFVTEYAGLASVMKDQLASRTRFGELGALAAQATPEAFVKFLFDRGFAVGPRVLPPTLRSLVLSAIPLPAPLEGKVVEVTGFATTAVTEDIFLSNLGFFLGEYRTRNPALFVGFPATFDAPALAREVHEKIVKPAREAQALLDKYEWLTRLYTTLSPQDMSKDPVFSFNPSLPTVPREHTATMEVNCGLSGDQFTSPARLVTEQGWVTRFPEGRVNPPEETRFAGTPSALRIETLGEEGLPKVLTDNSSPISKVNGCGCATDPAMMAALSLLWLARRRVARR